MSSHATAELLSAYLDRQLVEPEARQLEDHLDRCQDCHVRLEGLRKVVKDLHNLEQLATPLSLEQTVARRIALSDPRESVFDRFEHGMSIFNRQSPMLALFAVIIALAFFIYIFSYTLHQRQTATTPVVFEDLPAALAPPAEGDRLIAAGRDLIRGADGVWVEEGLDAGAASRVIAIDSEDGRAFLAAHPELASLADVEHGVVLEVDGEVVRLEPPI